MHTSISGLVNSLQTQGFITVENVFSDREMDDFTRLLNQSIEEALSSESYKGRPTDTLLGRANDTVWTLWELYGVCEEGLRYTRHPAIIEILETALGEPVVHASPGTMFDKVAGGDASIGWHQDSFFIMDPPDWDAIDVSKYRYQFGHLHVRPNQMNMDEDYYRKSLIVRINVDEQTSENGVLRVLPGSYLEGPFELHGDQTGKIQSAYVEAHKSEAIECVAGRGSVTFYYPTTLHSSGISTAAAGTHRRAAAHRMRASSIRVPGWEWPTDWTPGVIAAEAEAGFDLSPLS
ncbi:MAG: hypothetical protein HOH43_12445 [Candidatus Latescibacteria bacterium]|jgi:ectoine hydroxylase-related dioxygenase (phytanoyl-CoA dioxygenase family)|nr:hypothetical protein [Candidatus Latescibacterota bacterium]